MGCHPTRQKLHGFTGGWAQEVGFIPPAKAVFGWHGSKFPDREAGSFPFLDTILGFPVRIGVSAPHSII